MLALLGVGVRVAVHLLESWPLAPTAPLLRPIFPSNPYGPRLAQPLLSWLLTLGLLQQFVREWALNAQS